MTHEKITDVLEEYLEMQTTEWDKPSWFDCLAFLTGYFDMVTLDMIMAVRKLQREGRVE